MEILYDPYFELMILRQPSRRASAQLSGTSVRACDGPKKGLLFKKAYGSPLPSMYYGEFGGSFKFGLRVFHKDDVGITVALEISFKSAPVIRSLRPFYRASGRT